MKFHEALREANIARQIEWTGGKGIDFTWRGAELAGEVGEVVDLLINAHDDGLVPNLDKLGEEIADSVICVDLTAMECRVDPFPVGPRVNFPWPAYSIRIPLLLAREALLLGNVMKKLEREKRGWPGSRVPKDAAPPRLRSIMFYLSALANRYGVDIEEVTRAKFNATSVNVGLETRLYTETE
jgi:hypothetical protein